MAPETSILTVDYDEDLDRIGECVGGLARVVSGIGGSYGADHEPAF